MQLTFPITSDYLTTIISWQPYCRSAFMSGTQITLPQFALLDLIKNQGGRARSKKLSDTLGILPASISSLTASLEKNGYIERKPLLNDRRVFEINCTKKAMPQITKGYYVALETTTNLLSELGDFLRMAVHVSPAIVFEAVGAKGPAIPLFLDLYSLADLCGRKLRGLLKDEGGGSVSFFRVLFELLQHPNGVGSSELACILTMRLTNLIAIMAELEEREMVKRSKGFLDKRRSHFEITNIGFEYVARLAPNVDSLFVSLSPSLDLAQRDHYIKATHIITRYLRRDFKPY